MVHYCGMIVSTIRRALVLMNSACGDGNDVTVDNAQANGAHGVHMARVRLKGDPSTYRLILAPADAPISIHGRPIGEHFALPLGEG